MVRFCTYNKVSIIIKEITVSRLDDDGYVGSSIGDIEVSPITLHSQQIAYA